MTTAMVLVLWCVGMLAARQLVAWLHAVLSFGVLSLANSAMRRDRPA